MYRMYVPSHLIKFMKKAEANELKGLKIKYGVTLKVSKSRKSVIFYRQGKQLGTIYFTDTGVHQPCYDFKPSLHLKKLLLADSSLEELVRVSCNILLWLYRKGDGVVC